MDRFIPLPEVKSISGLSRATIYTKVTEGTFPIPYKLGRATRWSLHEISEWVEEIKRAPRGPVQRNGSPQKGKKT